MSDGRWMIGTSSNVHPKPGQALVGSKDTQQRLLPEKDSSFATS